MYSGVAKPTLATDARITPRAMLFRRMIRLSCCLVLNVFKKAAPQAAEVCDGFMNIL